MRFFKLTHPPYPTDREDRRRNPVTSTARHRLPGMSCDVCGPWSSSSRLRLPLPSRAEDFAAVSFLSVAAWNEARDRWAKLLGVHPDLLKPGATLGPPSGTCTSAITEDVVHPIPGEIWAVARVCDAVRAAGLTGVSFAAVKLPPDCGRRDLSELVVHGRAWRQGSTETRLRLCDLCGRRGFPAPKDLRVDESRWDGSDRMFLDGNPNIVVVSARAAEVFNTNDFTNVVAEPLG